MLTGGGRKMGKSAWDKEFLEREVYTRNSRDEDVEKAEAHIAKIKAEERKAELANAPKFKKYTTKWPLGPTGSFYNSMGTMCNIKDMKTPYISSTKTWLLKNFNFTSHLFAKTKYEEFDKEIVRRQNEAGTPTASYGKSERPRHNAVKEPYGRWR